MRGKMKIYAYDFFDTIVHRKCNSEELLFLWAKWVAELCEFSFSSEEIYIKRKACEKALKKEYEEPKYKNLINVIYRELHLFSYISEQEFLEQSYEFEVEKELQCVYLDREMMKEIRRTVDAGNIVIIVSDFYAGKDYIERILDFFNIKFLFSGIFVSSDLNKRKSTGNLYKFIIRYLNVNSNDLVMTGDNLRSDVEIPSQLGINSVHRMFQQVKLIDQKELENQIKQFIFMCPERNPLNSYSEECAYFIGRLYKEVKKRHISIVLFCSREGQVLKEMFDYYINEIKKDKTIQSEYFYISRKAAITPSLNDIEKEDFNLIFRQYKNLRLDKFLKCLNFSEEEIESVCNNENLSLSDEVSNDFNNNTIQTLKTSSRFRELYDKKRNEQRKLLIDYLYGFGVKNDSKVALVDVGWKGTIQDALQKVVAEKRIVFIGFYMGLKMYEYNCSTVNNKFGLLFSDYPKKSRNYDLMARHNLFWERILSADHGPTIGYIESDHDNQVKPLLDYDEKNTTLYQYIMAYQANMIDCCKKILELYSHTIWEPCDNPRCVERNVLWRECVIYPQISHIERKTWSFFEDNFGSSEKKKIDTKQFMSKIHEYAPYGFNKQVYDVLNNSLFLRKLAILYCKLVYAIKLVGLKF